MWIVILYVCFSQTCGFIDSPPVHSQDQCNTMLANAVVALDADNTVVAFDGACVQIQMGQV